MSTEKKTPQISLTSVRQLRQLSRLLDNLIRVPGTSYGIGLDPVLGLIPGGGDLLGGLLSAYIVFKAFQFGVPRETLIRMASNIALETIVGVVPVLGDVFDVAWKANVKNVEILETYIDAPPVGQQADQWFVWLLIAGLLLLVVVISLVSVAIIALLWNGLQAILTR